MAKLFIVGFPKDMKEIGLLELFSTYGTVSAVTIITDIDTGLSKGYGFIVMDDAAGAARAIAALDGASIDNRTINVRMADNHQQSKTAPVKNTLREPYSSSKVNADSAQTVKKKRPRRPL